MAQDSLVLPLCCTGALPLQDDCYTLAANAYVRVMTTKVLSPRPRIICSETNNNLGSSLAPPLEDRVKYIRIFMNKMTHHFNWLTHHVLNDLYIIDQEEDKCRYNTCTCSYCVLILCACM